MAINKIIIKRENGRHEGQGQRAKRGKGQRTKVFGRHCHFFELFKYKNKFKIKREESNHKGEQRRQRKEGQRSKDKGRL